MLDERHPYKPIKEETKEKLPVLVGQIIEGQEREITMRDEDIRRLKLEVTRLRQEIMKLDADIKDRDEQLENLLDKKIRLENDVQNQIDEAVKDADAKHSHF